VQATVAGTLHRPRRLDSRVATPISTQIPGRPRLLPALGPFLSFPGTSWPESISIRMKEFTNQLASAILVLLYASAMLAVGKSYAESQASKTFVVPAKQVVQAR
jgi:hypothetical protein